MVKMIFNIIFETLQIKVEYGAFMVVIVW